MGLRKTSTSTKVSNDTSLSQEIRKTSNKQPNLTPKATRGRTTNKIQS